MNLKADKVVMRTMSSFFLATANNSKITTAQRTTPTLVTRQSLSPLSLFSISIQSTDNKSYD